MFKEVIDAGQIEGPSSVVWREYAKSVDLGEIPAWEVWQRGIVPVMNGAMAQAGAESQLLTY